MSTRRKHGGKRPPEQEQRKAALQSTDSGAGGARSQQQAIAGPNAASVAESVRESAGPAAQTDPKRTRAAAMARPVQLFPWMDRTLEACWLIAAAFLPIFIMPETLMAGFVQMPKVFLLRSVALLAVVLLVVEWALRRRQGQLLSDDVAAWRVGVAGLGTYAKANPIVASALGVLAMTLLSVLLSPMWRVSIEGSRPGWDTYALYNVASWVVLFGLVASRMRSRAQFERLIWALTAAGIALGVYGILQHFGFDPFRLDDAPKRRVPLTVGNPIFGASVLLMIMPMTLALWQTKRDRMGPVEHVLVGASLIVLPLTAFLFTLARGGFLALGLALVVFAAATVWLMGKQALIRPAASFGIAVVIAFGFGFIPVPEGSNSATTGDIVERFGSIAPELAGGGLSDRYNIWRVSSEAFFTNVWPDTVAYPEVPSIIVEPVRPLVGYGPDLFGYVYNLVGDPAIQVPPVHAHNFPIHIAVELGLFGLLAYGALVLFVGLGLWRLLRDAKRRATPTWATLLVIGATAVFLARLLEQQGGKAQIADLTMAWVLAGAVVALVRVRNQGWPAEAPSASSPTAARKQPAPRGGRRPVQRSSAPLSVSHVAIAALVAIGALAFWWQAVGSTVVAASLTGRAIGASNDGDSAGATSLIQSAMDISPKNYNPRIIMSRSWQSAAEASSDPAVRTQYLGNGLAILQPVLDRDPMSRQANVQKGEMLRLLAAVDPGRYVAEASQAWEVVARLMPGLWAVQQEAASSFINFGRLERGLGILEQLREQGAEFPPDELDYMQAKALLLLDRADEAAPLVARIEASDGERAEAYLADLRSTTPAGQ